MSYPSILHIAEDMDVLAGGVPAVVRQLIRRLSSKNYKLSLAHVSGNALDMVDMACVYKYIPRSYLRSWGYSNELNSSLRNIISSQIRTYDFCHIHGVWKAPQLIAARYCMKSSVPYLFSIHGMLEPWLWNEQGFTHRIKKTLFWSLLAKKYMARSTLIHAITSIERDHLHALLPGCTIEVIPNAIDLDVFAPLKPTSRAKKILFLGRLEPIKGIDLLIKAFSHACLPSDWTLEIVGPSWSDVYVDTLHALVSNSGLSERVRFHGPLIGLEKQSLLAESWVMAVPSHSEVVGLVNLESAACLLPSITTHQTGLADWQDGGGILVSPQVDSLSKALAEASAWSDSEQLERGLASRALVEKKYSWTAVMPLWDDLYSIIST